MSSAKLSDAMTLPEFDSGIYGRDGYGILRALFDPGELEPLIRHLRAGGADSSVFAIPDNQGGQAELLVWTRCGDDFIGSLPRLGRMIALAQAAIGEPVYHWHSKITFKAPDRPGSWEWHQDYGHWYTEGCLWPRMASIGVALDGMAADNGPLRLLRGSHHLGRIDHVPLGTSHGADPERVERAREELETIEIHLEPGDAVVFHCNLLHASGPNRSERPRSLFMSSYNAVSNPPSHPRVPGHEFAELERLDDDALIRPMPVMGRSTLRQPDGDSVYGYQLSGGARP